MSAVLKMNMLLDTIFNSSKAYQAEKNKMEAVSYKSKEPVKGFSFEMQAFFEMPIKALLLSPRVKNILHGHEIDKISDLLKLSRHDLAQFLGMGKGCIREIEEFLQSRKLELAILKEE